MQIKIPPDLTIFHDCLQTDTVLQLKETLGSRVMLVEPSKIKLISMDQFTNKVTKELKDEDKLETYGITDETATLLTPKLLQITILK
ncbi:hypothetical protein GJ496_005891 [Pomphorhynchus laevis]|nr:hypothetical protein GJ496_005891 [Pomphorhynchus laevis]